MNENQTQPSQPKGSNKTTAIIASLLGVAVVLLIVSAVMKKDEGGDKSNVNVNQDTAKIDYCTAMPEVSDSGSTSYPVNLEKYGSSGILGQLFTADDCGSERVSQLFGVRDNEYTLWPDIGLKKSPSASLLNTLKEIGFERGDTCKTTPDNECTHWSLKKNVGVEEILRLKPYSSELRSSGCINCG